MLKSEDHVFIKDPTKKKYKILGILVYRCPHRRPYYICDQHGDEKQARAERATNMCKEMCLTLRHHCNNGVNICVMCAIFTLTLSIFPEPWVREFHPTLEGNYGLNTEIVLLEVQESKNRENQHQRGH